jgi:hypothetical protein
MTFDRKEEIPIKECSAVHLKIFHVWEIESLTPQLIITATHEEDTIISSPYTTGSRVV